MLAPEADGSAQEQSSHRHRSGSAIQVQRAICANAMWALVPGISHRSPEAIALCCIARQSSWVLHPETKGLYGTPAASHSGPIANDDPHPQLYAPLIAESVMSTKTLTRGSVTLPFHAGS